MVTDIDDDLEISLIKVTDQETKDKEVRALRNKLAKHTVADRELRGDDAVFLPVDHGAAIMREASEMWARRKHRQRLPAGGIDIIVYDNTSGMSGALFYLSQKL